MLKVEKIEAHGFEAAIRGMRNPMNSWDKSDSVMWFSDECEALDCQTCPAYIREDEDYCRCAEMIIGENDMKLMKSLFKAGPEHRKYLRMITVTMDITAPLYWWKEFDTYKIGTVANSCSTMHKIHAKEFDFDDFSTEHLIIQNKSVLQSVIDSLNEARQNFLETKDKMWWRQMIQLLPSSYNQKRTVMLNYEVIYNIIRQRSGHKLDEWHQLIEAFKECPYVIEIMS